MLTMTSAGTSRWLTGARSQPLTVGEPGARAEAVAYLEPGSILVAYSDGLVERRGEDLRVGLQRLEGSLVTMLNSVPDAICDRLMEEMGVDESRDDDVVLIVVQYHSSADSGPRMRAQMVDAR
jgi:hypothetical protein